MAAYAAGFGQHALAVFGARRSAPVRRLPRAVGVEFPPVPARPAAGRAGRRDRQLADRPGRCRRPGCPPGPAAGRPPGRCRPGGAVMAGRRRAAPAAEVTYADVPARQVKMLGSLPVIASFCRRLDISGIIDELVPIRDVATVSAGQAVEAMVCNRLTSPAPLVHVQGLGPRLGGPGDPRHPRARPERRQAGPHPRCDRPAPGGDHRGGRGPRDRRLRHRHQPAALGHDQLLALRRLRAARRGLPGARLTGTPKTAGPTCCRSRRASPPPATAGSRSTPAPTAAGTPRSPR